MKHKFLYVPFTCLGFLSSIVDYLTHNTLAIIARTTVQHNAAIASVQSAIYHKEVQL